MFILVSAMAEGNGEVLDESMKIEDSEKTEDYQKLIEYGLDEKVNICIHYFQMIRLNFLLELMQKLFSDAFKLC